LLSREEKERRVIELTEEHKSIREIAKEVNMSFVTIGSIRRRYSAETGSNNTSAPSRGTQVFKLFEQGKSPIEVAIELDLKSDKVTKLYTDYWKLKGLHDLNQLYEQRKNDLAEFHAAYKIMKDDGVSPRQLVDAANCLEQPSLLETRLKNIKHDIQTKENQKQAQMNELSLLRNDITLARQEVDSYVPIINTNKEEIAKLSHHLQELESLIARLKNTGEYRRVERAAEVAARKILGNNKMILKIALGAVIQALKDDPDLQQVISGSLRDPTYGARSGIAIRNYLINYNTKILEVSGQIFNDILGRCINNTMSSLYMT
jgi:DNA-binding CsgD family transcriptional regulator